MSQKKSNTVCGPFCKSQTRFSPRCIWYNLPCLPPLWAEATAPTQQEAGTELGSGRKWRQYFVKRPGTRFALRTTSSSLFFSPVFFLPSPPFFPPPGRPFLIIKKSSAKKVEKVMKEFYILAVSDLNLRKCCIFVSYFYLKTRA